MKKQQLNNGQEHDGQQDNSDSKSSVKLLEPKRSVAFHEAGHAAGIYLNNKAKQLSEVSFKIIFKAVNGKTGADVMVYHSINDDCIARVEAGIFLPFIDSLRYEVAEYNETHRQVVDDYRKAVEMDIINLLIGPLAEAKDVADTDNELFNHSLVNLDALKNYGGSADVGLVNEYLQSFSTDRQQRNEKSDELFNIAFNFVNDNKNWVIITKLANYILESSDAVSHCDEIIIQYEDIVLVLDQAIENYQDVERRLSRRH
ncbi:MAG: hypothetical protein RI893_1195 [Pseudomonadota bacterium]|jgi:hypothetical protein